MDAKGFFAALFGEDTLPGKLVLWKPGKPAQSEWCEGVADASELCHKGSYPYFGCALQAQLAARRAAKKDRKLRSLPRINTVRGCYESTVAIPGVWLDVDVQGPGHTKAGLPPTCAAAEELLRTFPAKPTLMVFTGGGFHAWWLFRELWEFDDEKERKKAAALLEAWQSYITSGFRARSWTLDSTFDLTRVLRMPGTRNEKYDVEVTCDDSEGPRWNPSELEDLVPGACWDTVKRRNGRVKEQVQVATSDTAEPPSSKFTLLLENNASFASTWRRERKDLPSQSEYDLALISMALNTGWSEQEATNLIIAHRRSGGQPIKHAKYYALTIARARKQSASDEAVERITARIEEEPQEEDGGMSPQQKRAAIDDVSAALGLPIVGIVKYTSDPPSYRLMLPSGEIGLGPVRSILNANAFREAVAAVSDRVVRRFRNAQWDPIAQLILNASEKQDLGSDSTPHGLASELVSAYIRRRKPLEDREEAYNLQRPFWYMDNLYLFLGDIKKWIALTLGERYTRVALGKLLRAAGCLPRTVAVSVAGNRTTMTAWCITALAPGLACPADSGRSPGEPGADSIGRDARAESEDGF